MLGKTIDQILREKLGTITLEDYPKAIKFKQLIDEAIKELETEMGEKDAQPSE